MYADFAKLKAGAGILSLTIPIVFDSASKIRIGGQPFIKNSKALVFEGETQVVIIRADKSKRKKQNKTAAAKAQ